jgi:hypothetical protein
MFEKCLDVLPPQRLLRQQSSLLLGRKVVPKRFDEKIFFISEFRIESGFVYPGGAFQILNARVGKPSLPKHRDSLLQHFLSTKVLRASHMHMMQ